MNNKTKTIGNLFEQTKNLRGPLGERLSGEPEILHEIQDWVGYGISRAQIQRILEYIPSVFPEKWKSPDGFDKLNEIEKKAYIDIMNSGPLNVPGPVIQSVIELGVDYRNRYNKPISELKC